MDRIQSASPDSLEFTSTIAKIGNEFKQDIESTADRTEQEAIGSTAIALNADQERLDIKCSVISGRSADYTSTTFTSSDDELHFPLKKKKVKHNHSLRVSPLSTIPILRLPSPPPTNGSEDEEQKKTRRRKTSFLASAHREPAWYEDVFDKEAIENTRMNLGSLTLRGESKEERAAILQKINNAEKVELAGRGYPKGNSIRWGETTIGSTRFTTIKACKLEETSST